MDLQNQRGMSLSRTLNMNRYIRSFLSECSKFNFFFRTLKVGRNFVLGCVFFFLFPTQNQVLHIIVGRVKVVYHIKALAVVIQTIFTLANFSER